MKGSESKEYWEAYYSSNKNPVQPSLFAEFVSPFLCKEDAVILELGCGNGRDSFHFADMGNIDIIAVDQCTKEIQYLNSQRGEKSNITFLEGDFTNLNPSKSLDYAYSRFTLHSVNQEGERDTFKWVSRHLNDGGLFFIEVRSIHDPLYGHGEKIGQHEFVTDHYRRFIEIDEMIANASAVGLKTVYSLQSNKLAPHKGVDPIVIRLIFQK